MCFFRKRRERKRALEAEMAAKNEQATHKASVERKVEEKKPDVVEKKVEPKEEVKVEPAIDKKVEPKENVKEAPVKKEEVEEKVEEKDSSKSPKIPKYHVSQNKDEGTENFKKWRVRKAGSTKTIKFFDTQKEAIVFAEQLAESAGSSVVIHKVDGSIRKQDYTKKE